MVKSLGTSRSLWDWSVPERLGSSHQELGADQRASNKPVTAGTNEGTIDSASRLAGQKIPVALEPSRPSEASGSAFPRGEGPLTGTTLSTPGEDNSTRSYIVFVNDAPGSGGVSERARALLGSLGIAGEPNLVFDQLHGFVLTLTDQQAQRLRALGGVKSVEADQAVVLELPIRRQPFTEDHTPDPITGAAMIAYGNGTASTGGTLPWGVKAVWQGKDISSKGDAFSTKVAFVIDSGIRNNTGDLNLSSNPWHRTWVGEDPLTDGLGHGTHVSGTIAAMANEVGVVGVAPGAQLVSLKVFNSSGGGGSYTSIIDAINHAVSVITSQKLPTGDVVINMSLGGGYSSSLDTAVRNAATKGIRFSIAAGNNGRDADGYSPAATGDHASVFTVSAVDRNYRMASFSNWDRLDRRDNIDDVDYAAPGVSVLSYNGATGNLEYWDGTSMATPHVTGLLLAGGVTKGEFTTPYFSNTADPFAWENSTIL